MNKMALAAMVETVKATLGDAPLRDVDGTAMLMLNTAVAVLADMDRAATGMKRVAWLASRAAMSFESDGCLCSMDTGSAAAATREVETLVVVMRTKIDMLRVLCAERGIDPDTGLLDNGADAACTEPDEYPDQLEGTLSTACRELNP